MSDVTQDLSEPPRDVKKQVLKYAKRLAFSKFSKDRQISDTGSQWECCGIHFSQQREFHKHVSKQHGSEVQTEAEDILQNGSLDAHWSVLRCKKTNNEDVDENDSETELPKEFHVEDRFSWLPGSEEASTPTHEGGHVLLFYKYMDIKNTEHVKQWQLTLCQRLNLAGKIRIATEGINGTVAGTLQSTAAYISSVLNHPLFSDMSNEDFKVSSGDASVFPDGLKVGVYQEIVPMGIMPNKVSFKSTGCHLSVDEFHEAVKTYLGDENAADDAVFVDCRNYYESQIGHFKGALCPNIRKFSYWPEYVDKNRELFNKKKVFMYCTGGIRCERGSAYLRTQGITDDVYQLQGGIHKYIEKYPEGYFRGKLFVFDDRYFIQANSDVVSNCRYCGGPWDRPRPCSSAHCHQLVLSCDQCVSAELTACCPRCQQQADPERSTREECDCTQNRPRIPLDAQPAGSPHPCTS